MEKKLSTFDFESLLGIKASIYLQKCIEEMDLRYKDILEREHDFLVTKTIKTLLDGNLKKAGEERRKEWEDGWAENYNLIVDQDSDSKHLIPKYFNKYNAVRYKGRYIQPISKNFEKNTLSLIINYLSDKYFRTAENIYEFGCGTGHNLLQARKVNKKAELWGLDWAKSSQDIINKLRADGIDRSIFASNFDYFNPNKDFLLKPNSVVMTVASLEQVGSRWVEFVDYLIENKPLLCVHIEPIAELLDENRVLDFLSIEYFKQRNYLSGFLNGLERKSELNEITIHDRRRTHLGSLFIEGYSIVVWSPN